MGYFGSFDWTRDCECWGTMKFLSDDWIDFTWRLRLPRLDLMVMSLNTESMFDKLCQNFVGFNLELYLE